MPVRPALRRVAIATAAVVVGTGFATAVATPAFALAVNDTATLNAAIVANEPLLEITADFTLTADLELIDYDVTIVGNAHTIDADGWDAFDIQGSASITDLTVLDADDDAYWIQVPTGGAAILTGVSSEGAAEAGIELVVADTASATVTGGTHEAVNYGIDVDAVGSASVSISSVTVTDTNDGLLLDGTGTSSFTVTDVTVNAGPIYNATYVGWGVYIDLDTDATATFTRLDVVSETDPADGAFYYGIETYQYDASQIGFDDLTVTGGYYGMYVDAYQAANQFTIADSSVTGAGFYGIYVCDMGGTAEISGTTISGNGVEDPAPGLYIYKYEGTTMTVSNSTITGNDGAGIEVELYEPGTSVEITGSTVSDNDGYGIDVYAETETELTVTDTTVADNGDVGIFSETFGTANVVVERSTVSGNDDGGVWFYLYAQSSASVVNSTISGNLPGAEGWGLWAGSGTSDSSFRLLHSTVTNNSGLVAAGFEDIPVFISHSIIAGNTNDPAYGDLWVDSSVGTDVEVEWSLIGALVDDSSGASYTEIAGVTTGVTDPGLEPLADNGGPTLTHLITMASPAYNAGDPAITGQPALDQRGGARIVGAAIDLGAVEVVPTLPATGVDATGTALLAGLLLLLGGGVVATRLARRRRES